MNTAGKSKLMLIASMFIYGTIGIFRTYIDLPSAMLAMVRGFVGTAFLLIYIFAARKKVDWAGVKAKLLPLAVTGGLIGLNWMLLFEAYNYTSVAAATLCYYMAPVFVILASPMIGEKIGVRKAVCVAAALAGMVLVSGVLKAGFSAGELKGVALGLGAAALYASVILMNKRIGAVDAYGKTVIQLFAAALVLLPYVIFSGQLRALRPDAADIALTAVLGVVHTGIAYALFFASFEKVEAQTVALFGYIDPAVAIVLSALVLGQMPDVYGVTGTVLIFGAMIVSEIKMPLRQK